MQPKVAVGTAMLACALPLLALGDDAAQVQNEGAAPAAAPADSGGLQEVVVTATRREQSLSKVPISITAMSADDMETRGIKDIADLARFTPGITVDADGTNKIAIRGISSSGGSGTTGIYIDDTPIQMRSLAFSPDEAVPEAFDIARVEVLRGPQGTLFGAGSEGGTVRYITTQPSLTTTSVSGRAELAYTQGGAPSYEAGVAAGGPLIDGVFGARVTAWFRKDGGWIDAVDPTAPDPRSAILDSNANYTQSSVLRLAGLWAVNDRWNVTPSFFFQRHDEHDDSAYWPIYSNPGSNSFINGDPSPRSEPDTFYLPALKIEGTFDAFHLISNTSFYHRKEQTGYDGTLYNLGFFQSQPQLANPNAAPVWPQGDFIVPFPLLDGTGLHLPADIANYRAPNSVDNGQENLVQEVRLVSGDPNARLVWTTGLFFSEDRQTYLEQIHDPLLEQFWQAVAGVDYTDVFVDQNDNPLPYDPAFPNDSYFLSTHAKDTQFAWYGEATWSVTDSLKATVGLRESHIKFAFTSLTGGPQLYNTNISESESKAENSFTPKVNISYQLDPANMVYASYAKGFRPGGGNNPLPPAACAADLANFGIANAPPTYNSDSVDSYELGAKNNIDNRLRISSSLYYIVWHNIQQTVVPPICQITFITNLGEAVAKGADIQIEWAATEQLSLELTSGYTDARYTRDSTFSTAVPDANGNLPAPIALSGDSIVGSISSDSNPSTPPFTAAVGVEYRFNLGGHSSFARVDYEYQAHDKWLPPTQDPLSAQYDPNNFTLPATSFVSLRVGMNFGDFSIQPFIDNLTDTHALTNYNWSIDPGTGDSRLERAFSFRPRTFGVTFTYSH
ncbi:MAG TPA: TonB-dependent receptor [Steroidobacteraceae bacterium]|nr:TonB-dependent receptor [Steroidobacteraceae bacterium]